MPIATFLATDSRAERGAGDLVSRLARLGFDVSEPVATDTSVLDSFDGRLHEAGLRLELRRGADSRADQHLVLSAAGSVSAMLPVHRAPRFAADLPVGPFRPRIAPALEMRALLPVVSFTDVAVTAVERNGSGKIVASITIHEPIAGAVAMMPTLIEVDELAGHPKPAARARDLVAELGFVSSERGLIDLVFAAHGVDPAGYASSPTVPLDGDAPAIAGFRVVLENLATTIDANWSGTLDDIDTEFLHELRVAIRRTRSVLGHAKGVLPDEVRQRYRDEFAWLASLTGPTRDLDVYLLEWSRSVSRLPAERAQHLQPVFVQLQRHRVVAFREMVAGLQSERVQALLAAWWAMLRHPEMGTEAGPKAARPLRRIVAKRIRDAHDSVIEDGRRITDDSPAEMLHDLRKDAKKLRYAVECFGGLLPAPERKAFVRQLKGLQDNLGAHQDADVHSAELSAVGRELASGVSMPDRTPPDTLLTLGALIEHLETDKASARAEFARRFAAYDSKQTRETLDALLDSLGAS